MFLPAGYIDPTAGGMLLQLLLGGVAAVFLGIQFFWRRILSFLGVRRDPPAAEPVEGTPADEDPK